MIEALLVGAPRMAGSANQSPLAHHAGLVTGLLQQHGDRDIARPEPPAVARYRGVAHVHPGHEGAPGGRADRMPRVMAGEAHSLCRHAIQPRCLYLLLSKTTEISITQIIGQDQDDVRAVPLLRTGFAERPAEEGNGKNESKEVH